MRESFHFSIREPYFSRERERCHLPSKRERGAWNIAEERCRGEKRQRCAVSSLTRQTQRQWGAVFCRRGATTSRGARRCGVRALRWWGAQKKRTIWCAGRNRSDLAQRWWMSLPFVLSRPFIERGEREKHHHRLLSERAGESRRNITTRSSIYEQDDISSPRHDAEFAMQRE